MTNTSPAAPAARMPAAVRTLVAFYGSVEAVESNGVAYRLLGEWVVLEAGKNLAANLSYAARI